MIKDAKIPILLIHGTGDHETPVHHSEELSALRPERIDLWLVPGAQHTGGCAADAPEFERRVLALVKSRSIF